MKIHHLNCGSGRIIGASGMVGTRPLIGRAPAVTHCLLIETDEGLVLVDTGIGRQDVENPTPLVRTYMALGGFSCNPDETAFAQVSAMGLSPTDVTDIFLTHFHYDHAGGLPDFPAARVHLHAEEFAGVLNPRDMVERAVFRPEHHAHGPDWVIHQSGDGDFFGLPACDPVTVGGVTFLMIPLPGHSRGICAVAVQEKGGWLVHCGDVYTYHGDVDPVNPRKPPGYWLYRPMWALSYPFRRIGRHSASLRALLRQHGDMITLTNSHDPVEYEKFFP